MATQVEKAALLLKTKACSFLEWLLTTLAARKNQDDFLNHCSLVSSLGTIVHQEDWLVSKSSGLYQLEYTFKQDMGSEFGGLPSKDGISTDSENISIIPLAIWTLDMIYLEEVGKSVEPEVLPGGVDVAVGRGTGGTPSWDSQLTMNHPLLPSIIHQDNPCEIEAAP
ncbi:hypothetical protein P7K49_006646 [Saguinus oedipus]|uniref:Uncharacterized protein n=1 Tax=Saguinus oedipus TaxID=9490 RepID=A0ABQ9W3H5_SAGOE|nr:hypothetical protein P7K49_006646 [Saguinus oedipus]